MRYTLTPAVDLLFPRLRLISFTSSIGSTTISILGTHELTLSIPLYPFDLLHLLLPVQVAGSPSSSPKTHLDTTVRHVTMHIMFCLDFLHFHFAFFLIKSCLIYRSVYGVTAKSVF
jgi:hypothetical protein